MYTIAIDDPAIYLGGETFARENHSSLKELVNKYVANLAAKAKMSQKASSSSWVDSFAGKWQDNRSTSQIIKDIHEARTSNSEIAL